MRRRRAVGLLAAVAALLFLMVAAAAQAGGQNPGEPADPLFPTRVGPGPEPRPAPAHPPAWQGGGAPAPGGGPDPAWNWRRLPGLPLLWFVLGFPLGLLIALGQVPDMAWNLVGWVFGHVDTVWQWIRGHPAGWLLTEVIRRTVLLLAGLLWFVVQCVAGILVLAWHLAVGAARGVVAAVRFAVAGPKVWAARLADAGRWLVSGGPGRMLSAIWDTAVTAVQVLALDIGATWSRWWHGLKRVVTDPDMTTAELLQVGEDTGAVVGDVMTVVAGAGVAVRSVRAARGAGLLGRLGQAGKAAGVVEAAVAGGELRLAGRATAQEARLLTWRIMSDAERGIQLTHLLEKYPRAHNLIFFMMERGWLVWDDGLLRGVGGTLNPAKLEEVMVRLEQPGGAGAARRLTAMMNNLRGGLAQLMARDVIIKEEQFELFIRDFRHPSRHGVDALAKYRTGFQAVEVKGGSTPVGPNGVSRLLSVENGKAKFNVVLLEQDLVEWMRKEGVPAWLIEQVRQDIRSGEGRFVYRVLVQNPTDDLVKLSGSVVNGIRIQVDTLRVEIPDGR